ncbi:MAG: aryl-sulfate sulfotransferase, partial [Erysipelotrichaceae bacterium]
DQAQVISDSEKSAQDIYKKINEITQMIDQQKAIDENILLELQTGAYDFNNPLIIVNPYQISPLTAIILFRSPTPVKINIHIKGKTIEADVDYSINQSTTEHILPIYGLYAGIVNQVTISMSDNQNNVTEKTFDVETEALMPSLSMNKLHIYKSGLKISPGFTFSYDSGNYQYTKSAFDLEGDYRWYLTKSFSAIGNYSNGKSLWVDYGDPYGKDLFLELNYLGKILNVYYSPYGNHHDIELTESSLLMTGSNNTPNTIEDFIYSIDRTTGLINHSLSYLDVLQRSRRYGVLYSNKDWMHMNSIVEHDDGVIVSSNYQSSIIFNDWNGNLKWILSDPALYTSAYQKYLLKPIGTNFLYPYNQHAAEILPDTDNNPDTIDIIVFDNGSSRTFVDAELQRKIKALEIIEPPLFSRMVQYQINEKDMTVKQIWQYGQDRPELFAKVRGDADLLSNGNYLGTFFIDLANEDSFTQHTAYVEIDANQQVVWECIATSSNEQNSYTDYRAERFEIYNESSIDLKVGIKANNFIPLELLQKAQDFKNKGDK